MLCDQKPVPFSSKTVRQQFRNRQQFRFQYSLQQFRHQFRHYSLQQQQQDISETDTSSDNPCYIRSCFMLLVFLVMFSRLLLVLFAGLSSILLFFLLFLLFSLCGLISSSSFSSPCGTSSICMLAGLFSLFNKPKVNSENNFKTST
jgi:hypothetical protein